MPKKPFQSLRSRGYTVQRLHIIGRASAAYCTHRIEPPVYAVRFRMAQAEGPTLAEAVTNVRLKLARTGHPAPRPIRLPVVPPQTSQPTGTLVRHDPQEVTEELLLKGQRLHQLARLHRLTQLGQEPNSSG